MSGWYVSGRNYKKGSNIPSLRGLVVNWIPEADKFLIHTRLEDAAIEKEYQKKMKI